MRDKNKGIYLFILDEERKRNRERALIEKVLREKFLSGESWEPTELLAAHSQNSTVPEELCKVTTSLSEMNLTNTTRIPISLPIVFLRCKKCCEKTDHVLVNMTSNIIGYFKQVFECQECGENKTIYELIQ